MAALLVLRRRQRTTRAFALTTHTIDLVAAAITLPMAGPTNSFFSFFLFVLAAAAFRWGFRETVATAAAGIALVLLYAEIASSVPLLAVNARQEFDRTTVRAGYLAMMGIMLGYLAEETRLLRAEAAAIVTLLKKIRVDAGLTRALAVVASSVVPLFDASELLLVVEDLANRRIFKWDTSAGWGGAPMSPAGQSPVVDRARYLFGPADQSVAFQRRWWRWLVRFPYRIIAMDAAGRSVDGTQWCLPNSFISAHPFRRLISAPVALGEEWSGRIFVINPKRRIRLVALTRFLQALVQQAGPAVFNVYLLDRLRARAGAIERARVARELHDGVIQSLIGVEMQLEVLRSQESIRTTPAAGELTSLQSVVRNEVLNLRELMQQMRPLEFDPEEFLEHIADMVQRFGRNTGINAHFSSHLTDLRPPPQICFELARIVQEGLVNVRKHSAATNVLVRFGTQNGFWSLELEDDGRGFPFDGQFSHADLDARRAGPIVIKERVRAIGGKLAIDSMSGRGARLEVLVPQEVRRSQ
jgi:signal transduction histidine kinase